MMSIEAQRDYHARRITAELDLAYKAEKRVAMEAHLRLSALHMARLASLHGSLPVQPASALAI